MKDNYFINFRDLEGLDDSNHLVFIGLLVDRSSDEKIETLKNDMTDFFRENGLIGEYDKVIGIQEIITNVRDNGNGYYKDNYRVDQLLTFNKDCSINPIARLRIGDLKWVSDFIVNYRDDYKD